MATVSFIRALTVACSTDKHTLDCCDWRGRVLDLRMITEALLMIR